MKIGAFEKYEILADAFQRMTGMMPPGKDEPAFGFSGHSYEERRDAWEKWNKDHEPVTTAMLKAMCAVMPDDD
jgi:hypothetical protein